MSVEKFVVVKQRGEGSKWERTGTKPDEDVFLSETAAKTRTSIYKHNVKAWRFGYIVVVDGAVSRVMEVVA